MTVSSEARLEQVQRYGTALRRLSRFLFFSVAFAVIAAIGLTAFSDSPNTLVIIGTVMYTGDTLTTLGRAIGIVTILLGGGLLLLLFFHMIRLFDLYASGRIFTEDNVRHMRRIGVAVFLFTVYWTVDLFIQLISPTSLSTAGSREITISLNLPFGFITLGIVIIFFSWIMDVGRELREEQDLVV